MRHGRRTIPSLLKHSTSKLSNLFLVASVSKSLAVSGTRSLDPLAVPVTESLVLHILNRAGLHPSKKVEFFKWASTRPSYKHSPCAYSQMFRTARLEEVFPLLRLMKDDGVVVDSATFKLLLDAFIHSGKLDSALEILDEMEELGVGLSPCMYSSILVAFVKKNQVGLALSIFYKLLEAPNGDGAAAPDVIACNELLVALRKADMRDEFKRVYSKLHDKGFEFNTWTYNICIHALGCWGNLGSALRLFKEMKDQGPSSNPDLCTYNSLIQVLCLVGKVKDALVIWEELRGSGHEPDTFSYRILIQGCCKSYRVDDAMLIFREMQFNGFHPDTIVYNSLLDGLFKARRLTEACQLF